MNERSRCTWHCWSEEKARDYVTMSSISESTPKLEYCTTTGYKDRQDGSPKGSCWWHRSAFGGLHGLWGLTCLTVTHGLRKDSDSSSPCCHVSSPRLPSLRALICDTRGSPRPCGQTVLRNLTENAWATTVTKGLRRRRQVHGARSVLSNICDFFSHFLSFIHIMWYEQFGGGSLLIKMVTKFLGLGVSHSFECGVLRASHIHWSFWNVRLCSVHVVLS